MNLVSAASGEPIKTNAPACSKIAALASAVLDAQSVQPLVDATIAAVKGKDLTGGARYLEKVDRTVADKWFTAAVLACTELPLATIGCDHAFTAEMSLMDSSLAFPAM